MELFYNIYGGSLVFVLLLAMLAEINTGKPHDGAGMLLFFLHLGAVMASFIFALIVFIFEDFITAVIALSSSLGYVIAHYFLSAKIIQYSIDRGIKKRKENSINEKPQKQSIFKEWLKPTYYKEWLKSGKKEERDKDTAERRKKEEEKQKEIDAKKELWRKQIRERREKERLEKEMNLQKDSEIN